MDALTAIKQPIQSEFSTFQSLYQQALKSDNALLNQVLQHLRKGQGKLMRPILAMLTARLWGEINPTTYNSAISLELLHTASLVHDDIVDESDKRRGALSVNAAFNNKVAVLSGDYLLSTSLLYVSKTSLPGVEVVSNLGQQLASGELLQLFNTTSKDFSEDSYYLVIKQKTASLFEACCQLGALSVGASAEQIELSRKFGEYIGLIFQIRDDIFDYFSDDIGKPTGNDMREGKLTLPALYVLNQSSDESLHEKAINIRSLRATELEIQDFIAYVVEHGGIEYARAKMVEFHDKALNLLPENAPKDITDALVAYLDFVSDRKK